MRKSNARFYANPRQELIWACQYNNTGWNRYTPEKHFACLFTIDRRWQTIMKCALLSTAVAEDCRIIVSFLGWMESILFLSNKVTDSKWQLDEDDNLIFAEWDLLWVATSTNKHCKELFIVAGFLGKLGSGAQCLQPPWLEYLITGTQWIKAVLAKEVYKYACFRTKGFNFQGLVFDLYIFLIAWHDHNAGQ